MKLTTEDNKKNLKYCIITSDAEVLPDKSKMEAVGFYQWINVFDGQIFKAGDILPQLRDGDFDIIHVLINPANFPVICSIRDRLGERSITKLVLSMDIPHGYWKRHSISADNLKEVLNKADLVFGTEHTLCRELEKHTDKLVYELAHPADIERLKACSARVNTMKLEKRILNVIGQRNLKNLRLLKWYAKAYEVSIRVILHREDNAKLIKKLKRAGIEAVKCTDDEKLCELLSEGGMSAPFDYPNYGKWVIYAAACGSYVIGNTLSDASRRCYPLVYTKRQSISRCIKLFGLGLKSREFVEYVCENAYYKVEYYNWHNMKDRFLKLVYKETGDNRFENKSSIKTTKTTSPVFLRDIRHISGQERVMHKKNEVSVVCLVKNGMEYLESFINYYSDLGVKHFVFIDNCSTDGTMEYLMNRDRVTLYRTELPHKHYESEIRRTVIENFFNDSWCLCVDIDEFFDYPGSDKISLSQFLEFLNKKAYTAVVAYMLDMFPIKRESDNAYQCGSFTDNYCYYDISAVKKGAYFDHNPNFCNYNILADKSFKFCYGGVRRRYFGKDASKYILIKHPLMFIDGKIEPVTDPHFCNKAYVADVSCILKHYKFTDSFVNKLDNAKNDYGFFGKLEHEEYYRILIDRGKIDFYSSTARKLENINDLIGSGFIKASSEYKDYMELMIKS